MADLRSVSVVVPAYNEAQRIASGLERLEQALVATGLAERTVEVLVVDDGSTDGTADAVRRLDGLAVPVTLIPQARHRGKGAAVRAGVAHARGELTCFIDADASIDPRHLADIVAALEGSPIAIGDRSSGGRAIAYRSPLRSAMGRIFNVLVRLVSGVEVVDTQCGCKGFTTAAGRLVLGFGRVEGFAFDVEFLRHAKLLGLEVAPVTVTWRDVAGSHVRRLLDPLAMMAALLRSRLGEWRRAVPAVATEEQPERLPGTVQLRSGARWFASVPLGPAGLAAVAPLGQARPLRLRWLARHGLDELISIP